MTTPAPIADYFQVRLGQTCLLIPLSQVREVLTVARSQVSPIPGVCPALLGVTNQRGKLLWVLQLAQLLNVPVTAAASGRFQSQEKLTAVLLALPERQVACVVSALEGIVSLDATQASSVLGNSSIDPAYLSGYLSTEAGPTPVLNTSAVITALATSQSTTLMVTL